MRGLCVRKLLQTRLRKHGLQLNHQSCQDFDDVKPDVQAKIFYCKILPILFYGSELWFSHASHDIEIVHRKFCKFLLNLPIQAPKCFIRSELRRYSIAPYKYLRTIASNDTFAK